MRARGACTPQVEGLHAASNGSWDVCELGRCADGSSASCRALLPEWPPRARPRAAPPLLGRLMSARFSTLAGGAWIRPHTGPHNRRLVVHFGVRVPDGALLRVGRRWRPFRQGACVAFDDSFEHEVRHLGRGPRVTLVAQWERADLLPPAQT